MTDNIEQQPSEQALLQPIDKKSIELSKSIDNYLAEQIMPVLQDESLNLVEKEEKMKDFLHKMLNENHFNENEIEEIKNQNIELIMHIAGNKNIDDETKSIRLHNALYIMLKNLNDIKQ